MVSAENFPVQKKSQIVTAHFINPQTIRNYHSEKINKQILWTKIYIDLPFTIIPQKESHVLTEYKKGYNVESKLETVDSFSNDRILNDFLLKFITHGFADTNLPPAFKKEFEIRHNIL